MNHEKINVWPRLHAQMINQNGDISAIFKSVSPVKCVASSTDELRGGVLALAVTEAKQLARPVLLEIAEGSEQYLLGVRPEGIVHPVAANMTIPAAEELLPYEAVCRACKELVSVAVEVCPVCQEHEPFSVVLNPEPTTSMPPQVVQVSLVPQPPALPPMHARNDDQPSPWNKVSPMPEGIFKAAPQPVIQEIPEPPQLVASLPEFLEDTDTNVYDTNEVTPIDNDLEVTIRVQGDWMDHTIIDDRTVVMPPKPKPTITVQLESGESLSVCTPVVIGRRPEQLPGHDAITLESPQRKISRTHARIDLGENGQLEVTDLDSTNGVYLNGNQILPQTPINAKNTATVEIGDALLTVSVIESSDIEANEPPEEVLINL